MALTLQLMLESLNFISDVQLTEILNFYHAPSFTESYELHDVPKPRDMVHCSSGAAIIATMAETDQIPTKFRAKQDLDDTISFLFSAACKRAQDSRERMPVVLFSKWNSLRLFVVAAPSQKVKPKVCVSIAAIEEEAMITGTDANIAKIDELKQYLHDVLYIFEIFQVLPTLHQVLRLRGGGGPVHRLVKVQLYNNFMSGDQAVFENKNYDEFMSRIPRGSVIEKLRKHSRPIAPSESTIRNKGLYFEEQLQVGKKLRRTTYQAIGGELIITFRSFVRPGGGSTEVEGEGQVSGNGAGSLRFLVKRAIKLKENIELRGRVAQDRALSDMKYYEVIRWFVLSCLMKGTLRVNSTSIMDGFIPPRIDRIDEGGIKLMEPIEMNSIGEVGGTVVTVGDDVAFRAHVKGELFKVLDIGDDGIITVEDRIYPENEAKVVQYFGTDLI